MMTRYFYDCEFIEDGKTIDLISIGIVSETGREYYAVASDAPWKRIKRHEWLMANVVPHLPQVHGDVRNHLPRSWLFNHDDPAVKPRAQIAGEVRDFLLAEGRPELWADYGAYDHVVLCQMYGPMINLPHGLPMFTNDIQQLKAMAPHAGDLPEQAEGNHNALADARHVRELWFYLTYGGFPQRRVLGMGQA